MTKPRVPTEILMERISGGLGVLDRHVHVAKLQANMKSWTELRKTLELVGATFDNVDESFGELASRAEGRGWSKA